MKKREIFMLVYIIVFYVSFLFFKNYIFGYSSNYFPAVGLSDNFIYQGKEKPLKTVIKDWEIYVYYKDFTLVYEENNPKKFRALERVELTTDKIRFGMWRIGIGSTEKQVELAYHGIPNIIDLPKNEIGYIDDRFTWITFHLNKENRVDKISYYLDVVE